MNILQSFLILGQIGVPDLATIFNVWSYQRKIELLKCLLIGEAVKLSVKKTRDLPCFGATGRNVLRPMQDKLSVDKRPRLSARGGLTEIGGIRESRVKLSGDDHVFTFSRIEIQMIVGRPIVQQRYCLLHQGKVFFF